MQKDVFAAVRSFQKGAWFALIVWNRKTKTPVPVTLAPTGTTVMDGMLATAALYASGTA